jgi:hypothetical protein
MHRNLMIFLIATACIFSGLAIGANTGKGFLLIMVPVAMLASLSFVLTNRYYPLRWLAAVTGFLVVTLLNHSRPGSILLILNTMVLFEALRVAKAYLRPTRTDYTLIQVAIVLLAFIAIVDLGTGQGLGLWYQTDKLFSLPRLRLLFSEPSYLGLFGIGLIFAIRYTPIRIMLVPLVVLTQSFYAIAYAGVLLFRRWPILAIGGIGGLGAILVLVTDNMMFFSNSGLVRLAGLSLLPQMSARQILIGAGLGAGDLKLQDLYDLINQTGAAGFLFSSIYDLGFFGLFFIYLAYVRSRFDAVHLTVLLLNLGMGSFIIPVLMSLFTKAAAPRSVPDPLARPAAIAT